MCFAPVAELASATPHTTTIASAPDRGEAHRGRSAFSAAGGRERVRRLAFPVQQRQALAHRRGVERIRRAGRRPERLIPDALGEHISRAPRCGGRGNREETTTSRRGVTLARPFRRVTDRAAPRVRTCKYGPERLAFFHSHRNTVPDIDAFVDRAGIVAPRARRVEMAGKRLPALGFVAAFLVAFNVFRNADHSGLPHTQAGRVDPLTATTASFVAPEEDGADPGAGHARDAVARSSAASAVEAKPVTFIAEEDAVVVRSANTDKKAGGDREAPLRPNPREGASRERERDPHPFDPQTHAEFGGDVVKWGQNFLVDSPRACHDACVAHLNDTPRGCNIWVYCPDPAGCGNDQPHKACWLKHQSRPANPTGPRDATNPWTSGSMVPPEDIRGERGAHKRFHVVVTTNANVYQAWQVRVMYYWYQEQRKKQDPTTGQMGGFTRVLHDDADALVNEIPTCVVNRLENEMGFVVLSRPNAFVEFFEKCPEIEEDYVLMAEPDHLYLRPLENLMTGNTPAAFPFFYIDPKKYPRLIRRFAGEHMSDAAIEAMDPVGSSPVFLHKDDCGRSRARLARRDFENQEGPRGGQGVGLGFGDVRVHHRERDCGFAARPAAAAAGAAAVGQEHRRLLHPALHLRQRLRPERRVHAGENRGVALRQADVDAGYTPQEPASASERVRQRARQAVGGDGQRGRSAALPNWENPLG